MAEDPRVLGNASDALPPYTAADADDTVTVSLSTAPGEWLVNTKDAVVVPMSMAELVEALQKRKLTERSLVWRAGMQEWAPVDHVPQLKLVARLGATLPGIAPEAIAPPPPEPSRPSSMKPPPKPVRPTPVPGRVTSARLTPVSVPTVTLSQPPRRTPLAFAPPPVRPQDMAPSGSPAAAPNEEPEALAVYARPAATASFDLSPEQPLRSDRVSKPPPSLPKQSTALETLAPLTSDSAPQRPPTPRSSDLSVVAAAHFRAFQRSSKRLVWISSLASAAAASVLTYWVARASAPSTAAPEAPAAAVAPVLPASAVPAAPVAPPTPESATPAPPSSGATKAAAPAAPPKPHVAARKPRPVAAPVARPRPSETAEAPADLPSAEPNPSDARPDAETSKPAPKAPKNENASETEKNSQPDGPAATVAPGPGF